jgi:hypothetical protein
MAIQVDAKTRLGNVKPCRITKEGVFYDTEQVKRDSALSFTTDKEIKAVAKEQKKEVFETAAEIIDDGFKIYDSALNRYSDKINKLADLSKKGSEQVRQATEKLSQGMQRIEKQSNFEKLEKYCLLLERAASAMTILAELEKNGKLEKIIDAIK